MVVRLTIAPSRLRTEILLSARRKLGTASPAGISTSLTIAGGTAAATSDDGSIGASGSATRRAVAPATGIAALSPRTKRSAASRSVIMFAGGGCRRLRVGFLGGTLGLLPGLSEYENFIDERLARAFAEDRSRSLLGDDDTGLDPWPYLLRLLDERDGAPERPHIARRRPRRHDDHV